MKFKYLLMLIWLLVYSLFVYGQDVTTNLLVTPPYSPYLNDYLQFENQSVLTVQNNTNTVQEIYLKAKVSGDNGIQAYTREDYNPQLPIVLQPFEVRSFMGGDPELTFFHSGNIETNLSQSQESNIIRTGVLPEGNYQICIEAYDYQTRELVSVEGAGCAFVQITLALPPEIISPMQDDTLGDIQTPIFTWTPPLGAISGADWTYELIIVPLTDGQNPYDAMELAQEYNAGNPILIEGLKSTNYTYGQGDVPLIPGPYAVRVRAYDENQLNLVENDGNSDILLFYFGEELWSSGEDEVIPYSLVSEDSSSFDNLRVSGQLYYKFKEDEGQSFAGHQTFTFQGTVPQGGVSGIVGEGQVRSSNNQITPAITTSSVAVSDHTAVATGPSHVAPVNPWGTSKYWKHDWTNTSNAQTLGNIHVKLQVHTVMHNVSVSAGPGTVHYDYMSIPGDYILNKAEVVLQGAGATIAETVTSADGSFTLEGFLPDSMGVVRKDFSFTTLGFDAGIWAEVEIPGADLDDVINPHDEYTNLINEISGQSTDSQAPWPGQSSAHGNLQHNVMNSMPTGMLPVGFDMEGGETQAMMGSGLGPNFYGEASYQAETAYNAVRIVVSSPFYCNPDVEIIALPGDQIDLPALTSYVQSYQLTARVRANDAPDQEAAGEFISDAMVEIVRPNGNGKTIHPDIPENEGQQLAESAKLEGYKLISKGINANPDGEQGDMKVVFERLVKYANMQSYDVVAYTNPFKGLYNYKLKQQTMTLPKAVPMIFNQNFAVDNHDEFVEMEPANPRVLGFVKVVEGAETVYLDGVLVKLKLQYPNKTKYLFEYTDNNGFYSFEDVVIETDGYEAQVPYITLSIDHPGYEPVQWPESGSQQLWKGTQVYKEFDLEPLGEVAGFVENEKGEPVMAFVRVENGPYAKTELVSSWLNYFSQFPQDPLLAAGQMMKFYPVSMELDGQDMQVRDQTQGRINSQSTVGVSESINADYLPKRSAFTVKAQSGNQRRLVIEPLSTQYFRDTFLVDINVQNEDPAQFLGAFQVRERLHRIKVVVKDFGGNPISDAQVHIDQRVKQTNYLGVTYFKFGTPETEFHVQVIPDGNYIKVDSFMVIQPSKDHTVLEFTMMPAHYVEGYVRTQSDSTPIEGARVYHVLHHNQYGEVTIDAHTDATGYYKLEGVPMHMQPIDFIATKYDEQVTFVGQKNSVAGKLSVALPNQPQQFYFPQTDFYLQTVDDLNLASIWGFDVEVKSYEPLPDGKARISGDLINIPGNANFAPEYAEIPINFKNLVVQASSAMDQNGIPYAEPVAGSFSTKLIKFPLKLYDDFEATLQNYSEPSGRSQLLSNKVVGSSVQVNETIVDNINGNAASAGSQEIIHMIQGYQGGAVHYNQTSDNTAAIQEAPMVNAQDLEDMVMQADSKPRLVVRRDENGVGYLDGYVLNELSSFNFTYHYTGKFYLGESPTEPMVEAIRADGNLPQRNYSLMVVKGDTPANAFFDFEKFPAHIEKDQSYVTPDTFKLFTVLHTAIPQSQPADLAIQAGMIRVLQDDILPLQESDYEISFSLGNWEFESLGGWVYDKNVSGILIDSAVIKTKYLDIGFRDIILYPDKPIGNLDDIHSLELTGVGYLNLAPQAKTLLGYNATVETWEITITNPDQNSPVGHVSDLPGFDANDKVFFNEILLRSNDENIVSLQENTYQVYDILNFSATEINVGEGFFQLRGGATLPIPGMQPVSVILEFTGEPDDLELNPHAIKAILETNGMVQFRFDQWGPAQTLDWGQFHTYGTFRIYEGTDTVLLRGELSLENGNCSIEVIQIDPYQTFTSAGFDYVPGSQDQRISLNGGKNMIVRHGSQLTSGNQWDELVFYANMEGYQGAQPDQEPMKFTVHGGMEVTDSEVKLDGIETPFGDFLLIYNFQQQVLIGKLTFSNMTFGAVNDMSGFMGFYVGAPGFMINGAADGKYPVIGQLKVGFIIGAYQGLPAQAINDVLSFCKMKKLPPHLAAGNIAGLFLTVNKPLWEFNESIVILPELLEGSIASEAGADARIWMNFEGGFAFELGILLYGNVKAMAKIAFCELCLGFAIEGGFAVSYSEFQGAGFNACLSAAMSASIDCGLVSGGFTLAKAVEFQAKEKGGTDIVVLDGDSCSGDMTALCNLSEYDASQDPEVQNQNQN